jgi:hypothetical protein
MQASKILHGSGEVVSALRGPFVSGPAYPFEFSGRLFGYTETVVVENGNGSGSCFCTFHFQTSLSHIIPLHQDSWASFSTDSPGRPLILSEHAISIVREASSTFK